MALRIISCFTYRTSIDSPWTDAQHSVNQFVDALKNRTVKGYGHTLINGTLPKRRIEASTAHMARDWFGEMAALILEDEQVPGDIALVPIPNCDCTVGTAHSRTAALAAAVFDRSTRVERVADVLRWDEVMPSAGAEGGPRDPSVLYAHLRIGSAIDRRQPHVLIDDVLTTGGHVRACAAFLRAQGADVHLVVCGARSDASPQADPFARRLDELEDFTP